MGSIMAKVLKRNKALKLRQNGESIKEIAKKLHVSKSTVCLWCSDVKLTSEQVSKLHEKMVRGSYAGRMKGAKMQHDKRIRKSLEAEESGMKEIGKLSERDLLIAMTALYWGEGSKKQRRLFINNSDPEMIIFLLNAFRKIFKITDNRFILSVGLNIIHKNRDEEIKEYWSQLTGIPISQFRKTIFIKAKNKKTYSDFKTYYGVLRINISKSIDTYYKMLGLIKGVSGGINKPA